MAVALTPVSEKFFFSRHDPLDPRLGEQAKQTTLEQLAKDSFPFAIAGYCDDSGIYQNGGRTGAKEAPDHIRHFLYRMTPDLYSTGVFSIADLGNLQTQNSLPETHQKAKAVAELGFRHSRYVSLGGGHDFGYCDGAGFLENCRSFSKKRPLIINFDAHLDVRPTDNGFHSGTPFRRLLESYPRQFDFYEIGIQPQCNSKHHLQWAKDQGAVIFDLEAVEKNGLLSLIQNSFDSDSGRPVWISMDIDAFCLAEAPGCSQSWPTGLRSADVLPVIRYLTQHFDVRGLGLYEVSPPLDQDQRTAKLAALILHHYLYSQLAKGL